MPKYLKQINISLITIFIFISYLGYASTFVQNDIFTSSVFLFLFLCFLYNGLRFDSIIVTFILFWLGINFVSANFINTNQEFSFITLIGLTLRILISYFIVKINGMQFFNRVIRFVYIVCLIDLFLFSIQLVSKDFFFAVGPYLNFITQEEQRNEGGWYLFVYMFSAWGTDRNCGFAWEPGVFSCVLVFLLCLQLAISKFKFDKYSIVFLISIITTFSTSGFLAMFIILISLIVYKKFIFHPVYIIGLISLFVFSIYFFSTSEFMGKKINDYLINQKEEYVHFTGIERINRIEEFNRGVEQSLNWPFGNGILNSDYRIEKRGNAIGPNSLSTILMEWGWIGIAFLGYSTFNLFNFYSKNKTVSFLLTIAFAIVLYSNPFQIRYLIYAIFFFYFKTLRINQQIKERKGNKNNLVCT